MNTINSMNIAPTSFQARDVIIKGKMPTKVRKAILSCDAVQQFTKENPLEKVKGLFASGDKDEVVEASYSYSKDCYNRRKHGLFRLPFPIFIDDGYEYRMLSRTKKDFHRLTIKFSDGNEGMICAPTIKALQDKIANMKNIKEWSKRITKRKEDLQKNIQALEKYSRAYLNRCGIPDKFVIVMKSEVDAKGIKRYILKLTKQSDLDQKFLNRLLGNKSNEPKPLSSEELIKKILSTSFEDLKLKQGNKQ